MAEMLNAEVTASTAVDDGWEGDLKLLEDLGGENTNEELPDKKEETKKSSKEEPKEEPEEVKEGEEETEEKPEEKPEEEEEEKSEEEKKLEEELKKEEKKTGRTSYKEITSKYPNFFKDFPEMRDAFFREQKFTELFPTVAQAESAKEDSNSYEELMTLFANGNTKEILRGMKVGDGEIYQTTVRNFLPTLAEFDPDTYYAVTSPLLQNVVQAFYKHAESKNDTNEMNSALYFAEWLFGDDKYAKGAKLEDKAVRQANDPEKEQLIKERDERLQKDAQAAYNEVDERIYNKLKAVVLDGFDPNGLFTPGIKDLLVEKIISKLGEIALRDESHGKLMKSLWVKARSDGFSREQKTRIYNTYLARVQPHIREIRKQVRDEALQTKTKQGLENIKKSQKPVPTKPVGSSSKSSQVTGNVKNLKANQVDWKKTSDEDFLSDRAVVKS